MSKCEEMSKNPKQRRNKDLVKFLKKREENKHFSSGFLTRPMYPIVARWCLHHNAILLCSGALGRVLANTQIII